MQFCKAAEGQMAEADWLKLVAWDDLEYFSARAMVDPRPFDALWVQEGLINNHHFHHGVLMTSDE